MEEVMAYAIRRVALFSILSILILGISSSAVSAHRNNWNNNDNDYHQYPTCINPDSDPADNVEDEGFQQNSFRRRHHNNQERNICATATPATFDPSTCDELGSYTIVASTGVDYTIDGDVVAPGTYTAENGTTVTIVAVAQEGYAFEPETVTSWTYTFNAPTNCEVPQVLSASTTTPQVTVTPTGPVHAGAGGGSNTSTPAITGFLVSILAVSTALIRKFSL